MFNLTNQVAYVLAPFQSLFAQQRSWHKAQEMLVGAILCRGERTVSRVLTVMGLAQSPQYGKYYRVGWSDLKSGNAKFGWDCRRHGVSLVSSLPWKANLYEFVPTAPPRQVSGLIILLNFTAQHHGDFVWCG
jgi:hypothetical protein